MSAVEEESNLVQHARRELELAGLFDEDSDYSGMLGRDVLEVVKLFASQGHSGQSAMMCIGLIGRLLQYKALMPITSDPEDWQDVSEATGRPMWQCKRQPDLFSEDRGQTWHSVNEARLRND